MTRVLLIYSENEYGDPVRGRSYAYYNFYEVLKNMPVELHTFDLFVEMKAHGRDRMNRCLLELAESWKPDVCLVLPYTDEFMPETIEQLNRHTITIAYFFDDMWRVNYSRFWAKYYRYVTTSDINGVAKFRNDGHDNAIYSPFACNETVYRKKNLNPKYDVSFVGGFHPFRKWLLSRIAKAGIGTYVRGYGWPGGPVDQEEMIDIFNQSRINLNISNSVSWDLRYLLSSIRGAAITFRSAIKRDTKVREQVKGRNFEINACGAFQFSYYVEGLEKSYSIGDEIVVYASPEELVEKIQYYLRHDGDARRIAENGFNRTIRDHTMRSRLQAILDHVLIGDNRS